VLVLVLASIAAPVLGTAVHERVTLLRKLLARGATLLYGIFQKVSAVRHGVAFVVCVVLDQTERAGLAGFLNHWLNGIRDEHVNVLIRENTRGVGHIRTACSRRRRVQRQNFGILKFQRTLAVRVRVLVTAAPVFKVSAVAPDVTPGVLLAG
jgi:hypothetical protein